MALALVRYGFRGRTSSTFVFLPLATPEVVLGAALLALFLTGRQHRLRHDRDRPHDVHDLLRGGDGEGATRGMDRHIEEAAIDLGPT